MREGLKKLTAVSALVLVAGASLVACSDDSDGPGSAASGDTLTKASFFDEITQAQQEAGTSHVAMAVAAAGQKIDAEGDIAVGKSAADTSMAMTMNAGQSGMGSLEMRLIDQVFYLNFGPMTDNKFAKVDLTDKSNPIGQQYGEIVGSLDPSQQLEELEGAVKSFDQKGKAIELDGVKAQPYVIVVDTSKIPSAEKAGDAMPKTLTYTMYIGPDNLPRRVITALPAAAGSGSDMTINYTKWGEKVSITKPKASEITDKDFFSQLGGLTPEA